MILYSPRTICIIMSMKEMENEHDLIPNSYVEACECFREILRSRRRLQRLNRVDFLQGWRSLFYIAPGLHPDEFANSEGGWPEHWEVFAQEAFRRSVLAEISESDLYPMEAQRVALGAGSTSTSTSTTKSIRVREKEWLTQPKRSESKRSRDSWRKLPESNTGDLKGRAKRPKTQRKRGYLHGWTG